MSATPLPLVPCIRCGRRLPHREIHVTANGLLICDPCLTDPALDMEAIEAALRRQLAEARSPGQLE